MTNAQKYFAQSYYEISEQIDIEWEFERVKKCLTRYSIQGFIRNMHAIS